MFDIFLSKNMGSYSLIFFRDFPKIGKLFYLKILYIISMKRKMMNGEEKL